MVRPFRRGMFSRVGLNVGTPLAASVVQPALLQERVAQLQAPAQKGQAQRLLVGVRRKRRGATAGIHHQQVPGVGTDVEYAQPHGARL